ncbi:MAG: hypothetical protein US82_C0042G0008 [Parcubacteria group bacterium GW2011_GWC1_38_22]|nr:MAG: hypothetical protein US82_C0042G0008 [Parcubacteria group bacterium GW2011_GWC1_38_22]
MKDLFWIVPSFLLIIFLYVPLQFQLDKYSTSNPPIFFSIGEAMAAVAILLAVYQFKREKWAIALEVKRYLMSTVYILVFAGFLTIIFSSVLPIIKTSNILLFSGTWQIISSLFIISAVLFLFFGASNDKLFNKNTDKEFVSALLRRVMSRSPQQIDQAVDVLSANFEIIIEEIKKSSRDNEEISEFKKNSHFILTQIISNPNFTNHVVTTRADFLQRFLHSIKEYHLQEGRSISTASSALIRALFSNKDSFFYNELKHSDFGVYYKPFLEDIFSDQKTFQNLRPFDQITFDFGEYVEIEKLKLFIEALEISLKGYFKSPHDFYNYSHFDHAFELVKDAFERIIKEACDSESKDGWHVMNKIHQITFLFGWKFRDAYKEAREKGLVSQNDIDATVDRKSFGIYPASITAQYAKLIFELMCALSSYPKKDLIRDYAISLTDDVLFFDEPIFANIRKVLLEYIWEKIDGEPASNIKGFYPVVLPVYLTLTGMSPGNRSSGQKELYNQVVDFLETKLKPKIIAGEKMANDELMEDVLLPDEVIFNREKNLFQWKMRKGVQDMVILE